MRCSPLVFVGAASVFLLTGCEATRSVMDIALSPFTGSSAQAVAAAPDAKQEGVVKVRARNLTMRIQASPVPLKLSETRQISVVVRLENTSRRFIQLEFPTSQRLDALLINDKGAVIARWSDDRVFEQTISYVGINPGEHVEYSVAVPTRDMASGNKYTLRVVFPNFEELKGEQEITPQP